MSKEIQAQIDSLMDKVFASRGDAFNKPIKWRGNNYRAIGVEHDFAIATKEQWENFSPSTAHCSDGVIKIYGTVVGKEDEVEWEDDNG